MDSFHHAKLLLRNIIWHVSRIGKIVGIDVFYRTEIALKGMKLT